MFDVVHVERAAEVTHADVGIHLHHEGDDASGQEEVRMRRAARAWRCQRPGRWGHP